MTGRGRRPDVKVGGMLEPRRDELDTERGETNDVTSWNPHSPSWNSECNPPSPSEDSLPGLSVHSNIDHTAASGDSGCDPTSDPTAFGNISRTEKKAGARQILTALGDGRFKLEQESLSNILLAEDVVDKPVVVISVAGKFRQGKSFLLDMMLRYLTATNRRNWVNEQTSQRFPWKSGHISHTTGILMWSHPIPVMLPTEEEAVILLMDTQGTFDGKSTLHESSMVFALSTLLSSLQIFNLMRNIGQDDLDHLQLFTEYGRMVFEDTRSQPFQKLMILVRDWPCHSIGPGAEGGNELLDQWFLETGERSKLTESKEHIKNCFTEISGFLLPHPGHTVDGGPDFDGSSSDMRKEFVDGLKELMHIIFSQKNLVVKKIAGNQVKAGDLYTFITKYVDLFQSDKIPKPISIVEATAEANNLVASKEARSKYLTEMEFLSCKDQRSLDSETLFKKHRKSVSKAKQTFHDRKKMGRRELSDTCWTKVKQEIEDEFRRTKQANENKRKKEILEVEKHNKELVDTCKKTYISLMETVSGSETVGYVSPQALEHAHKTNQQKVMAEFNAKKKEFCEAEQLSLDDLQMNTDVVFKHKKIENEHKAKEEKLKIESENMMAVEQAKECYKTKMSEVNCKIPLGTKELEDELQLALQTAIKKFESLERGDGQENGKYIEKIQIYVNGEKEKLNAENHNKWLEDICKQAYISDMERYVGETVGYIPTNDLQTVHNEALNRAMVQFEARKKAFDGTEIAIRSRLAKDIETEFSYKLFHNQAKQNAENLKAAEMNMKAVTEALRNYNYMKKKISSSLPLTMGDLENRHQKALQAAKDKFESLKKGELHLAHSYFEKMQSEIEREKESLYADNHNKGLVDDCKGTYKKHMQPVAGETVCAVSIETMNETHANAKKQSLIQFDTDRKVFEGDELSRANLERDIEVQFSKMLSQNEVKKEEEAMKMEETKNKNKKAVDMAMRDFMSTTSTVLADGLLSSSELEERHKGALQAAIEKFESLKEGDLHETTGYLEMMKKDIELERKKVEAKNHNMRVANECKMQLRTDLETISSTDGNKYLKEIDEVFEDAKQKALDKFDAEKQVHDGTDKILREELVNCTAEMYREIALANDDKRKCTIQ